MVSIERVRNLGECRATVVAACYEEVVGGGVGMVGDAYLVGAVCGDPFPVVHCNSCSGRVENERVACWIGSYCWLAFSVLARARAVWTGDSDAKAMSERVACELIVGECWGTRAISIGRMKGCTDYYECAC